MLACPRHFPGSASLRADPHYRLPVSSKPMADLWREDLVPFREVLPQVPMVEVSAGGYKAYDFDLPRPAMLSRSVVEGMLRVKLGYTGVGVADVRGLKGERDENVAVEGAIRSLQAGCDLVIVSSLGNEFELALDGLELNVKSGKIPANRVQQALNRIQQCKKGLALPTGEMRKRDLEKLVRKCYEFNRETQ